MLNETLISTFAEAIDKKSGKNIHDRQTTTTRAKCHILDIKYFTRYVRSQYDTNEFKSTEKMGETKNTKVSVSLHLLCFCGIKSINRKGQREREHTHTHLNIIRKYEEIQPI